MLMGRSWEAVGLPTLLPLGDTFANGGRAAEKAMLERLLAALEPLRRREDGAATPPPAQVRVPGGPERGFRGCKSFRGCNSFRGCKSSSFGCTCPTGECVRVATAAVPGKLANSGSAALHAAARASAWRGPEPAPAIPRMLQDINTLGLKLYRSSPYGCGGYSATSDAEADFAVLRAVNTHMRYGETFFRYLLGVPSAAGTQLLAC